MTPFSRSAMVPLYPVKVFVAFGDTLEDANKALPSNCDGAFTTDELTDKQIGAIVSANRDGRVAALFTNDNFRVGTLAHESVHVSMAVMSHIRMGSMDKSNEEAYAYVAGWFARFATHLWQEGCARQSEKKPTKKVK